MYTLVISSYWYIMHIVLLLLGVKTSILIFYISSYYFLSGGREDYFSYLNNILYFNKTEESWQPAGQMKEPRYAHAVEVIEDVSQHCP